MPNAKIQFTVGAISFSGEGDDVWLAVQLDKIMQRAPELIKIAPLPSVTAANEIKQPAGEIDKAIASQTLPNFLKEKNAATTQITKFLVTAAWLHARGKARLTTADVVKALKDSNQTRLGNASDMLNKNISKGFCEKDGKGFFVTNDGKASLGIS